MVVIPAGAAVLGTPAGEPGRRTNEAPPHDVAIAKPFALGRYAVTFEEWDACVAEGGCKPNTSDLGFGRGRRPDMYATLDDAADFIAYLNAKTGGGYRLPSEAEWEYAARACPKPNCAPQPFWFGAISPEAAVYDARFSYGGSPKSSAEPKTQPVDFGRPNPFGLFNMAGNISQWMADCWNPLPAGARSNGAPWTGGDCGRHVVRGGSWADQPEALRAGARSYDVARNRSDQIGFRVARNLEP